jgi:hypothetical protein
MSNHIRRATLIATLGATLLALGAAHDAAHAACIDLQQAGSLTFEGRLTYRIFPGPPNYEDVRRGDTPEPTYILELADPVCATGEEADPSVRIDRVQVFADQSAPSTLWSELRGLVGQRVIVAGRAAFGAHTGHHHAPLLLPISQVAPARDPTEAYGTAMTTVQAFYLALGAGNGEEAARFVIPHKRQVGPLSANAITSFYGSLAEPLRLLDVASIGADEFRVRYSFVTRAGRRCDGAAIVRTVQMGGANLIESIKALDGC